jgi:hypothetical protein
VYGGSADGCDGNSNDQQDTAHHRRSIMTDYHCVANVLSAVSRRLRPGMLLFANGHEVCTVERYEPLAVDTRFQMGSVSKIFTATVLVREKVVTAHILPKCEESRGGPSTCPSTSAADAPPTVRSSTRKMVWPGHAPLRMY